MSNKQPLVQKVRFWAAAVLLYGLSLAGIRAAVLPAHSLASHSTTLGQAALVRSAAHKPNFKLVVGRPIRIVIRSVYVYQPNEYIDVSVDEGYYSITNNAWTLSDYHAQFDMSSSPANNYGGETFIYGHNNDYVFGAFRHHPPTKGAVALVYTSNDHSISYKFSRSKSLSPTDVSALNYQGSPVLLVQTCTGSLNQWRTMYWFSFDKVVR